ncbi:MAG: DUF4012 domain-containing protein [Actinomycetota bacterium]|nr:DUF4012 domain-containing protein [Actinomycetota bacterium]
MSTSQVDAPTSEVRRSRRRSELTTARLLGVSAIAVLGAVLAIATTDAAPTGWTASDVLYTAGFVVVTVAAASRARRWSLLISAAVVSIGLEGAPLLLGLAALVIALVLAWRNRRNRVVGALVGALVAVAALLLTWPASPSGATAVLAAASVAPVWISGYRVSSTRVRRRLLVVALVGLAVLAVGVASGAAVALTQRDRVLDAADRTSASLRALGDGDRGEGTAGFEDAAEEFSAVVDVTEAWWAAPARATPVVAQNLDAVRTVARAGAHLNTTAAELGAEVDYDELRLPDGRIDLARLAAFEGPVAAAADAVASADVQVAALDSPWIAAPVRAQLDDLSSQLVDVRRSTTLAAAAVDDLPALLGAEGPRRYLLLLGNPAEARDLGGHLGNWAEIVAVDGRLDVVRVGTPYDLFGPATEPRPTLDIDVPPALSSMQPARFPQNWSSSPDLATVAELAAELYPQAAGGAALDGVLYADPFALAALLAVTGPITTSDATVLSDTDAVEFLTQGQFLDAAGGDRGADATVTEVVELALDRLTTRQLPAPATLAEHFGPVIADGRLQFHSLHPEDRDVLALSGLDRPVEAPRGGDLLAVVNRNSNPSKIDTFLERSIDYDVDWDPATGHVRSRVVVTMTNDVPDGELGTEVTLPPPGAAPGTNRTQLSIVTPLRATGALVEGDEVAIGSTSETDGLQRHTVTVDLPPGERRTVTFDLTGEVARGERYRLRWIDQPLVRPTDARLLVQSSGAALAGGARDGMVRLGTDRVTDITVSTVDAPTR